MFEAGNGWYMVISFLMAFLSVMAIGMRDSRMHSHRWARRLFTVALLGWITFGLTSCQPWHGAVPRYHWGQMLIAFLLGMAVSAVIIWVVDELWGVDVKAILATLSVVIVVILVLPSCGTGGKWTKADYAWEGANLAVHVVDWGQTRAIAREPKRFSEQNPLIGKHPSVQKVDLMFLVGEVLAVAISDVLPPPWRRRWQVMRFTTCLGLVVHNHGLGIRLQKGF